MYTRYVPIKMLSAAKSLYIQIYAIVNDYWDDHASSLKGFNGRQHRVTLVTGVRCFTILAGIYFHKRAQGDRKSYILSYSSLSDTRVK